MACLTDGDDRVVAPVDPGGCVGDLGDAEAVLELEEVGQPAAGPVAEALKKARGGQRLALGKTLLAIGDDMQLAAEFVQHASRDLLVDFVVLGEQDALPFQLGCRGLR